MLLVAEAVAAGDLTKCGVWQDKIVAMLKQSLALKTETSASTEDFIQQVNAIDDLMTTVMGITSCVSQSSSSMSFCIPA